MALTIYTPTFVSERSSFLRIKMRLLVLARLQSTLAIGIHLAMISSMNKSKLHIILFAISILLAQTAITPAMAEEVAWTDEYDLTPAQLGYVQTMEKNRGQAQAVSFAKAIQHSNSIKPPEIPPHTEADIRAVSNWGQGTSFAYMAHYAGYTFNQEQYMADCPNIAIFNFGSATNTQYLHTDVLAQQNQMFLTLLSKWNQNPKGFRTEFMKMAQERGFSKYLIPVSTSNAQ